MNIKEMYQARVYSHGEFAHCADIFEHLPTLKRYATGAAHITEFGTRTGNSTTALLAGLAERPQGGELHSYDINQTPFTHEPIEGVKWTFYKQDTGQPDFEIQPTNILFIDSLHEFTHIMRELRHAKNVMDHIIFHDTAIDWITLGGRGPIDAVTAFLARNHQWKIKEVYENNNGLTVLERR